MRLRLLPLCLSVALLATCSPVQIPANLPPDPPTAQKVTPSNGASNITWTNPTDSDFNATVVVRYAGAPDAKPSGAVPAVGAAFGSGTVLYADSGTSVTDTTLPTGCNVFTYQFWTHDRKGQWSEAAVIALTLPGGLPAPSSGPKTLLAGIVGQNVHLTWMPAAASSGATVSKIVRQLGKAAATSDQGTSVYQGVGATFDDSISSLPRGQTLFYTGFGCNACGACSPLSASATVLIPQNVMDAGQPDAGPILTDGGTELQPMGMAAALSSDGLNVQLTWTNPTAASFTQVKVLRQLAAPPLGPNDTSATTLFTGLGATAQERVDQLLPSVGSTLRQYYYVVYGCADALCEGVGAQTTFSLSVGQALHGGGYTLWWRHLPASDCGDQVGLGVCTMQGGSWSCPTNNWWKSCVDDAPTCVAATARQLTPNSSDLEAQTIHDQFIAKSIPIGRVLASEFCRAQHSVSSWSDATGHMHPGFDFGPTVESVKELTYYVYDEAHRCDNTKALLNEAPAQGKNTAMVSHAGFTCTINGGRIDSLNWGDCAIFKPDPVNGPIFIEQLSYDAWANLQ
jgi:hypothetical protein